jgi:SAM-dependent methyltransferase
MLRKLRPVDWILGMIAAEEVTLLNLATLDALDLQPTDHVLETGFGQGRAVERAARVVTHGTVTGVESSNTMIHLAKRRCRRWIEQGRVKLEAGTSSSLPFFDASFDKAYTVHTVWLWTNPTSYVREVSRVLKPGGWFAIGLRGSARDDRAVPLLDGEGAARRAAVARDHLFRGGFSALTLVNVRSAPIWVDVLVAQRAQN